MSKHCPGCGATTLPEARFCRLCGAPLKTGGLPENNSPISPKAQTAPLKAEARSTDGLAADDSRHGSSETSKVGRTEMEEILRRVEADYRSSSSDGKNAPERVETVATQTTALNAEQATVAQPIIASSNVADAAQPAQPPASAGSRRMWTFAAIALLCVALVAGVLAFILSRRAAATDAVGTQPPISISDQKQLLSEKLAEAEPLLEAGEFNHAIEVLRAAVKIDPTSVDAHMRLGNALERTGARGEAIEEYRAASLADPNNVSVLRALASAQVEENLYNDATESYRRMLAANANSFDDETWLAYGDALRLAGRKEEARSAYQKISASSTTTVAQAARQHLAELGPPPVVVNTEHSREANTAGQPPQQPQRETEVVLPTPQPTPLARATVAPTAAPVAANGAGKVDYDAYYFQALNVVNGRDPKKIERAELLHALYLFQRAALGGAHQAEAQRYADRLGKEYDRRRK
jgi:tetratricopeptide (TPR) repeat protein